MLLLSNQTRIQIPCWCKDIRNLEPPPGGWVTLPLCYQCWGWETPFFRAVRLGDFSLITNKITKDTHATKSSLFIVIEKGGERCKILCPWGDSAFCAGNINLSSSFSHCLFPARGSQKGVLRGGKLDAPQKGVTEQWRLGTLWYNIARCQIRSHYSKISNKIPTSHSTGR